MAKKKTEKASPFVPMEEQPYQVPENWCWLNLHSISEICTGRKDANYGTENGQYPFFTCAAYPIRCDGYSFDCHAILLAGNGDISNISLFDGKFEAYQRTYVVKILQPIITEYCYYYFKYRWVDYNKDKMYGTAIPYIRLGNLNEFSIPIAPIAEQQRIVARIESLFSKLDEAKEKAQEALDSFETRKVAVLHRAFLGELTEGWRKAHDISFDAWKTVCWGDLITSIEAGKNWKAEGRPPERNEFGVVKVSSVTWGEFNELESKTCTSENQWNKNVQIHEGDFLFSRANTLQLVGNCVIAKNVSRRLMLSDKILRLTFSGAAVPEYILYFTRSDLYRQQIEQLASGNQDGMRNVSQKNMKLIEFPVALLPEQIEIVRILDAFFELETQAKAQAETVLETIDIMKKSILAKAYRGELGTNNPEDESAEELLKRTLA